MPVPVPVIMMIRVALLRVQQFKLASGYYYNVDLLLVVLV